MKPQAQHKEILADRCFLSWSYVSSLHWLVLARDGVCVIVSALHDETRMNTFETFVYDRVGCSPSLSLGYRNILHMPAYVFLKIHYVSIVHGFTLK